MENKTKPGLGASKDGTFILGADISQLYRIEAHGGTFRCNGKTANPVAILKEHGINFVRVRLWHDSREGCCNLKETLRLAKLADSLGLGLLLDIHYSDTWADPGHQTKPAAWSNVTFDSLIDSMYAYTKSVIGALDKQHTPPAIVQIGNEIECGILWDDGRVCGSFNDKKHWDALTDLLKAGIKGARESSNHPNKIKIMIHVSCSTNTRASEEFFDRLISKGVDFDLIGLSYYPWWHGSMQALKTNMELLASRYEKGIVIAETAYPWTLSWKDDTHNIVGLGRQLLTGYPATVAGQERFITDLIKTVKGITADGSKGIFYWGGIDISAPGMGSSCENIALFDFSGDVLKSVEAFQN